jgi:HPt (histidine-containing phosphotransfer) domain-containing protein
LRPAFDRAELIGRVDGDLPFLQQLVQLFAEGLPAHLQEIERAILGGDGARLSRHAHSLKGALLNLAAAPAAEVARQLEDLGRAEDLSVAPAILARLRAELLRLQEALAGEVADPTR